MPGGGFESEFESNPLILPLSQRVGQISLWLGTGWLQKDRPAKAMGQEEIRRRKVRGK